MKTWMKLTTVAAAMTAGLAAQTMKANIPFEFKSRGETKAAGEYRVEKGAVPAPGVYLIRNEALRKASFTQVGVSLGHRKGENKLVFDCGGARCVLLEVWVQGNGYEMRLSPVEREARTAWLREVPLHPEPHAE